MSNNTHEIPKDIDAEENLIGSLVLDGTLMTDLVNRLKSTDFYSERHMLIYAACESLYKQLVKIDQVSIAEELNRQGRLETCGGAAYLSHLVSICATTLDWDTYAEIIKRLSISRKLIMLGEQVSDFGYKAERDIDSAISRINELANQFRKANVVNSKLITPLVIGNEMISMVAKYGDPVAVPRFGFKALDDITAGIFSEYIVFGARTSVGKTQLAIDITENVVQQGRQVLFASAEMATTQLIERRLAKVLNTSILEIRKRGMTETQREVVMELAGVAVDEKINYLAGGISLDDVYKEAVLLKERQGLDVVVIDYLGALRECYEDTRDNQVVRVSRVSHRIQDMVKELDIPIIVLCQLNRDSERRADGANRPQLHDLRDSGSIEQDADVVFLLWRDAIEDGTLSPLLNIHMAKNRQLGVAAPVALEYNYRYFRYQDVTNI